MSTDSSLGVRPDGEVARDVEHHVQLGVRLRSEDHAAQPLFSNFTGVQGGPGMVFIDFGFLEPNVLPSVLRAAQGGGKVPEAVNGRLAARVVLGVDLAAQLMQQLNGHLRGLQTQPARAGAAEGTPH